MPTRSHQLRTLRYHLRILPWWIQAELGCSRNKLRIENLHGEEDAITFRGNTTVCYVAECLVAIEYFGEISCQPVSVSARLSL